MIIKIYDINTDFSKTLIYLLSSNFTSIAIVKPYSLNAFSSETFLICKGLIHKDLNSEQVIEKLKEVFNLLKSAHTSKSNDLETLLVNSKDPSIGININRKLALLSV